MAATGMMSSNGPTKYNSRMGESSAMGFGANGYRQTSNAYSSGLGGGVPVLKKNYTSDNFNHDKPYPMNRGGSQHMSGAKGDFNSYFRSSAAAMFGTHAIAMPKITTNHIRAKF